MAIPVGMAARPPAGMVTGSSRQAWRSMAAAPALA